MPLLCNDRHHGNRVLLAKPVRREAMDQGYTFLRLPCNCGRITDFPFPLLLRRKGVSRDTFIGSIGLESTPPGGQVR